MAQFFCLFWSEKKISLEKSSSLNHSQSMYINLLKAKKKREEFTFLWSHYNTFDCGILFWTLFLCHRRHHRSSHVVHKTNIIKFKWKKIYVNKASLSLLWSFSLVLGSGKKGILESKNQLPNIMSEKEKTFFYVKYLSLFASRWV